MFHRTVSSAPFFSLFPGSFFYIASVHSRGVVHAVTSRGLIRIFTGRLETHGAINIKLYCRATNAPVLRSVSTWPHFIMRIHCVRFSPRQISVHSPFDYLSTILMILNDTFAKRKYDAWLRLPFILLVLFRCHANYPYLLLNTNRFKDHQ